MDNAKYFNSEYKSNKDKWLCADAWAIEDIDDIDDSNDNNLSLPGAPFIIQMVNSDLAPTAATSNVDIGDSYTNRMATNFGQATNIATTSTVAGITYREFLAATESHPFKVGKTMIISTTAGQIEQPITVTHRNSAGKRMDFVISPTIDPNQGQTDRVIDDTEYLFDGMTRIRFSQVDINTTVSIRLYPKDVYSATRIIAGLSEIEYYKEPFLNRSAKVSI